MLFLRKTDRIRFNTRTISREINEGIITIKNSFAQNKVERYERFDFAAGVSNEIFEKENLPIRIKIEEREDSGNILKALFVDLEGEQIENIPMKIAISSSTELSFAIPVNEDGSISVLENNNISIFAFLPTLVKDFVFPFYINANFILDPPRQRVLGDSAWNLYLFKVLAEKIVDWSIYLSKRNDRNALNILPYKKFDENILKNKLAKIGESLVVVKDDDIVKVHVHTLTPGDALNIAQRYGEFIKLKIENMQEQHSHIVEEKISEVRKEYGIISVCSGDGLNELFKELRVDTIISGGQTMNPSCESFVEEINKLNAEHIFILPNNSNIILAANQAKDILSERDIHVLPTKTIPEGIAALSMYSPEAKVEDNLEEMQGAIANIASGSVTYAIKDTTFNGIEVKKGDFIAMTNKTIVAASPDRLAATLGLLDEMFKKEDAELITLISGEGSTAEEISAIEDYIADNSDLELEVIEGGQPVYSYLFGVE